MVRNAQERLGPGKIYQKKNSNHPLSSKFQVISYYVVPVDAQRLPFFLRKPIGQRQHLIDRRGAHWQIRIVPGGKDVI